MKNKFYELLKTILLFFMMVAMIIIYYVLIITISPDISSSTIKYFLLYVFIPLACIPLVFIFIDRRRIKKKATLDIGTILNNGGKNKTLNSETTPTPSYPARIMTITVLIILAVISYYYGLNSLGIEMGNMSAEFSIAVVFIFFPLFILPMTISFLTAPKQISGNRTVVVPFLVLYGIWFYIFILPDSDYTGKGEPIKDNAGAWVACQRFVEQKLTSPSTADYPWDYRDKVEMVDTDTYLAASYVDSQNGFGATVRSTFSCKVKQNGDSWELITLALH